MMDDDEMVEERGSISSHHASGTSDTISSARNTLNNESPENDVVIPEADLLHSSGIPVVVSPAHPHAKSSLPSTLRKFP
eukprot:m.1657204 g.1657204  ORF g.1657204 m.1657204 type:complete len:79 (-) comp110959_c0_seq1:111-347(-)